MSAISLLGRAPGARLREALGRQRVVLVKPPMQMARGNHVTLACPPLGVAYLAAALREQGAPVLVVDAVGEGIDRVTPLPHAPGLLRFGLSDEAIVARIPRDATVIGVSSMFSEEWPLVRGVLHAITAARPDAVLIAGGEHVSAVPELVLRECPGVRVCVLGEGEETLVELVNRVAEGRTIDDVEGTVVRDGDGARRNRRRARVRAIDALPAPAWDLLPMEEYLSRGLGYGVRRGRSVPILATRGCPFQCTFCSSPMMWTTRWAARDPDAVLAEMADAIERFGAQNFDFYDLTAIIRRDWILEFSRKLADKRWGVTWQIPAGTRSEAIDAEVSTALYASGCRNIAYAPESGSDAVLTRVKKKVRLDRMKASMRDAIAAGLKVKCNVVVGFPDETRAEMRETAALCRDLARLGVHDVNVTPFCPYPGSALFDELVRDGRLALDDGYFTMLASYSDLLRSDSFCRAVGSRELGWLRWSMMAEFYAGSFARHPARAFDLVANVARGRQTTRLEKSLTEIGERQIAAFRSALRGRGRDASG